MSRRALAVEVQNASGDALVPSADRIRGWARLALARKARGELTIRIVAEEESAALNTRYRDQRGPTNVLAFPADGLTPADGAGLAAERLPLGDLVICAPLVAREAGEQGKALEAHWAHIVIHGSLHLIGYDHETDNDAAVMEGRERELLAALGFPDPYSAAPG